MRTILNQEKYEQAILIFFSLSSVFVVFKYNLLIFDIVSVYSFFCLI